MNNLYCIIKVVISITIITIILINFYNQNNDINKISKQTYKATITFQKYYCN
jgi:hypothetical protein